MEMLQTVLLVLVGIGSGFVQRVSGFGLGIFSMLFLPHFLPTHTAAAAISTLFSCGTSVYNAVKYRKNIAYKTVFPMLCAAMLSIPVAVYFSSRIKADFFNALLGAVLIILSLYFIFFSNKIVIRPTVSNGIFAGALGGVLNGLFSTGGPPAVMYLNSATADNITYFATIQFYFSFTNVYATVMRAINGDITQSVLIYALVGFTGCMIGDFIGKQVFDRLDSKKIKTVIYCGMIVSGIIMMF